MIDFDDLYGIHDDDPECVLPEDEPNMLESEGGEVIGQMLEDDGLSISDDDLNSLEDRASEIDRSEVNESQISFGRKMCPTRGGCQGATDCDYSYGSYPG